MSIVYPDHRNYYDELTSGSPEVLQRWLEAYGSIITTHALETLTAGALAHAQPLWLTDDLFARLTYCYLEDKEFENAFTAWGKIKSLQLGLEIEEVIRNQLESISLGRYFDVIHKFEWERLKLSVSRIPEGEQKQFAIMLVVLMLAVLSLAISNLLRMF